MSYRPTIKTNSAGATSDFPLDAETLKGHAVEETGIASNTTTIPTTAQVKAYVDANAGSGVDVMTQTQFDNATGGTSPDIPVDTFSVEEINIDDNLIDGNKAKFVCDEYDKRNLINSSNIIVGRKVYASTGEIGSESSTNGTDYIEIEPNTRYINNFQPKWSGSYGVAFYNSNKTYISGYNTNSSSYRDFTTPSNAKYLIICWYVESGSVYSTTNPSLSKYGGGEIIRINDIEPVLLWENGNPSSQFDSSSSITIGNASPYKYLILSFLSQYNNSSGKQYYKINRPSSARNFFFTMFDNGSTTPMTRAVTYYNETSIKFSSGYKGSTANEGVLIPVEIFGSNI